VPFKSQQQRKWMYANDPEMAKEWEKETPKGKKLPKYAPKKKKKKKSSLDYRSYIVKTAADEARMQAIDRWLPKWYKDLKTQCNCNPAIKDMANYVIQKLGQEFGRQTISKEINAIQERVLNFFKRLKQNPKIVEMASVKISSRDK